MSTKNRNMSNDEKIQAWEKHLSRAKEKEFYSIQRIDLLTISISGACIYIAFEILRFLNSPTGVHTQACTVLLKISAIASVLAITINFLSQILGYHANKYEAKYSQKTINQLEGDDIEEAELNKIDFKSQFYSKLTFISNIVATILMSLGIILLVIFNLITF